MHQLTPQSRQLNILFQVRKKKKKGVGVCFSAHPGITGLRIAQTTQDRQRLSAHARTNYI